jgi:hypothetical protein
LVRLKPNNPTFVEGKFLLNVMLSRDSLYLVQEQFQEGWKHDQKPIPHIHAVYEILHPDCILKPYLDYKYIILCHVLTMTQLVPEVP